MSESGANTNSSTADNESEWVKTTVKVKPPGSPVERVSEPVRKGEPYIETLSFGQKQFPREKNKMAMTKEMNTSNLVKAALKTPLSDVLRKNIAAEKVQADKQKREAEEANASLQKSGSGVSQSNESKGSVDSKKPTTTKSVHKGGARKTVNPLVIHPEPICKPIEISPPGEGGELDEPIDQMPRISTTRTEPGHRSSGPLSSRFRKMRKRHFKGATYGLYLCPARKKQKCMKKVNDTNSRDDEMSLASTENGSCIDSDASSMFSDFTPSEKSLADDEACPSLRCSPVLLPLDHQSELTSPKERTSPSDNQNSSCHSNSHASINDKSEINSETSTLVKDEANVNHPQATVNTSSEQCPESEQLTINHLENSRDLKDDELLNIQNIKEEIVDDGYEQAMVTSSAMVCQGRHDSARKTMMNYRSRNKLPSRTTTVKIKSRVNLEESAGQPSVGNETPDIHKKIEMVDEARANPSTSTIATSVKSRQRMKRRFTDDIVDTDLGLLSLNSLSSCRKIKQEPQTQAVYIKDLVTSFGDFKEKLAAVPKAKSISRAEYICHPKKAPMDRCCCVDSPILLDEGKNESNVFCQGVDNVDDKRVGCCHPVIRHAIVRQSTRMPFTIMCDMHLCRLRNHHCCPRCGMFCSQGTFMSCPGTGKKKKINHLFHEACAMNVGQNVINCPHCGNNSNIQIIQLNLSLKSSPGSLAYSNYFKSNPVAKMTARRSLRPKKNATMELESGSVLSPSGLLSSVYQKALETMLIKLSSIKKEDIPNYSPWELYPAIIEGNVLKLLFMLSKGISPNTKFPDYSNGTALHAAASVGNVIEAHVLIQAGCTLDSLNDNLQTPVMLATENNKLEVVEYLVYRKADIGIRGEAGSTCLHLSAKEGNTKMCSVLLGSCKIKLNLQDDGGWTPLVWASEHGHYDIVELLLERGANPNIRDKEGNTALHWAAYSGNVNICDICLTYGCNINEQNLHGDTPLHIAARRDNSAVVDYLLSNMASSDVQNEVNQVPFDCCIDDTASSRAIKLNEMMTTLIRRSEKGERIVTSDISFGKERIPIQCVNWFDDENLINKDFLYVTENCETSPINIDRSITSLQCCDCGHDCASVSCTCCNISFKCWYDKEGRLLPDFNMFDPPMVFECNRACICDASTCRNRVVQRGLTCLLQLFRTANKGWGVRTLKDIPKGTFICEYVGELISDSEADKREDDSYLFDLDNRDGETYCLDARHFGNVSRFINHLCEPNLIPVKVFVDHQDLSFPRIAFFSARDIAQYEELGFDYGEKFWIIKSKWFTCTCGSIGCKYSSETIQETLDNYNERNAEEHTETTTIS